MGCLNLLIPPFEGVCGPIPLLRLVEIADKREDMFTLEELDFDHIFCRLSSETVAEDLPRLYVKCIQYLNVLHKDYSMAHADCGLTLLITTEWMFLAPIYKPIANEAGSDVFLDPLAYLGILHIPVLQKKWPETAGISLSKGLPMELLTKASKHVDPDLIPL